MKARRDVTIEGLNVSIKGQVKTEIEAGAQVSVKAPIASFDASGAATVKGAVVTIKGVTSFTP